MKNFFLYDIISLVPADLAFYFIMVPQEIIIYFRIFYLFKFIRVKQMIKVIIKNSSESLLAIKCVFLFIGLLYFSHIVGCIFTIISKIQYYYITDNPNEVISVYNKLNLTMPIFLSYPISDQFLNELYAGFSLITTCTYGDFYPIIPSEKVFAILIILISRFLTVFLYAEASSLIGSSNKIYIKHINKVNLVKM